MQAKLVAGLFIILVVLWGLHHYIDKSGYERRVAEENAAIILATEENDKLKLELEVQHAQANAALNIILATPAPRVRIPICPPGESNPATRSEIPITGSERTYAGSQELLDEAGRHLESKAAEWSRSLNACAVVMEWANQSR